VLAFALVAACSRDEGRREITTDSAAGTAADTLADSDEDRLDPEATATLSLLRELADRDEALIEMARLAITRREQLQVSADARRILSEQRRESNRLLGMLRGEYHLTHQPTISPQDQPLLDSLNGGGVGEFDSAFLRIVAKHHEDDVGIIDRALPKVTAPAVRGTLTEIRAQRANEAAAFRKRLGASPSAR
jgi:predicted outer membrane protein